MARSIERSAPSTKTKGPSPATRLSLQRHRARSVRTCPASFGIDGGDSNRGLLIKRAIEYFPLDSLPPCKLDGPCVDPSVAALWVDCALYRPSALHGNGWRGVHTASSLEHASFGRGSRGLGTAVLL